MEVDARKAKRGLWSDPNPVPPWEWRRIQAAKRKADKPEASGRTRARRADSVAGNPGKLGKLVKHANPPFEPFQEIFFFFVTNCGRAGGGRRNLGESSRP